MDELLQEFIAETRETLEALSGEIVAWEADPGDRARLDSIFRFVHTVKGSCGFLDLPRLARLSHAAEDALDAVRAGRRIADRGLVDAVLAIVDRIGEIVEAIDAGAAIDDSSEDLLIAAVSEQAPAAQPLAVAAQPMAPRAPSRSVRLSVDLLDRMMSGMSEMVLARNDLARRVRDERPDSTIDAALERLSLTVAEMRDTVTRTRMQTIDALFSPLPRLVRDTAAAVAKPVALTITGGDVELDREMIEMLRDPLVHMVRNAIDHGLETAEARRRAGKPETGRLSVSACQSGNRIIVEIEDDGRGIDVDRLVGKLAARQPERAAALAAMDDRARLNLVFEPGLSSRDEVSALSGRGVGMDVVRANVEQIGGRIQLRNRPGQGLSVVIEVPLTLSILSALVVMVGDQSFALPRSAIEELVAARSAAVRIDAIGDSRVVAIRDRRLPLVDLAGLIGLPRPDEARPAEMIAVIDVPNGAFALAIDDVADMEELVVKPAAPAVMAAGIYAGQTLPDNGLPLMLLDAGGIAAAAGLRFERGREEAEAETEAPVAAIRALLFEDLDGHRRVIPLAAVDRVEPVRAGAIAAVGGRTRLVDGDRTIPLVATGGIPRDRPLSVIRLHDARGEVGLAIAAALDIVALDAPISPVAAGLVAGVTVVAGEPVELVDPLQILATLERSQPAEAPLCLLDGSDPAWMEAFLAPILATAGYRATTRLGPGDVPAVTLRLDDAEALSRPGERIVRLSRERAGGIDCYDRGSVIAAVAAALGEGR